MLEQVEFIDPGQNPEPRCAVVVLVDTSNSMSGEPIKKLNEGLEKLAEELQKDKLTELRVEIAIVSFGGSVQVVDVHTGSDQSLPFDAHTAFANIVNGFKPPELTTSGLTPMGEAVRKSMALIDERKKIYRAKDLDYYRPWLFLITDGYPTDDGWEDVANELKQAESQEHLIFFGVGVEGADMQKLSRFCNHTPPMELQGLEFSKLFAWLSNSLGEVSHSHKGDEIALKNPGDFIRFTT